MSELRNVHLRADLCAAVEQRFARRFAGIESLLTFVLQDLLRDDASKLEKGEEQIIEERLRELGYI
ncbi:MAG: hypothetical protein DMG68_17865 [Acidobacteria bacterium]|jgi:hypothetical protein|nr:MAG: hypothetical protein DMG68_17865 [Acidobacteriota bacterium]